MNKNVVRIQTEMFKPGAVVKGPSVDLYADPPLNSAWWPHLPRFTWFDDPEAGLGRMLRFDEGGFFFTFAALGIEINGRTNGDIDFLLQTTPAAELFRPDLAGLALLSADRFEYPLLQACWASLAVYDADVSARRIELIAGLELEYLDSDQPEEA